MSSIPPVVATGYIEISLATTPSTSLLARLTDSISKQIPIAAWLDSVAATVLSTPLTVVGDIGVKITGDEVEVYASLTDTITVAGLPSSWSDTFNVVKLNAWEASLLGYELSGPGISESVTFRIAYVPVSA